MYIPIMKTRQEELNVSEKLSYCFSEQIIPLFEILNEKYKVQYEIDNDGNYIMEKKPGKKKMSRVKKKVTENDIVTLEEINRIVDGAKVFIDYFRFDVKKYGSKIDINSVTLAYTLNNNTDEYIKKLMGISKYENMIPVLSLKKSYNFTKNKLIEIINKLQDSNSSIALRIEDELYDSIKDVIIKYLRETDYLLYDINEQDFDSKFLELEELKECTTKAKKILLNSPRDSRRANKDYENNCITRLISNSAAKKYRNYDLDGFGDYGGLKDQLPPNSGSNGKGAALALLYNYDNNSVYSFCNADTSLGTKGYVEIVSNILNYEDILNPNNDCVAYLKIKSMSSEGKYGSWRTWNNIALTRYIHQMYLATN
jgi:hypothetical protein